MTPVGLEVPASRDLSGRAAIVGLGISEVGKVYNKAVNEFAADAVLAAVADAGLELADVDGVIMSNGLIPSSASITDNLGLKDLGMSVNVAAEGATAAMAVQYASMAVNAGIASTIVYVHADCPLRAPGASGGAAYGSGRGEPAGFTAIDLALGLMGGNAPYALMARRHMEKYGTTSEQFGAIAVAQRRWATMNPMAQMRTPITLEDHQSSRWICEPLHLLDCCLVSNGAVAVVVTSAERAVQLAQPPVYVWGWGQGHPGYTNFRGSQDGLRSGATRSGEVAFAMAGIGLADIDVCELYDSYTFTVLLTLEDYGFVQKGEGGPFAATGALGPGGSRPTNTGGGQLSAFYLWGATPLHEAVVQARGHGGERQVTEHDFVLVSGSGGSRMDHHATLILGANARA
jgi:acetyl-CoA acetyltransferase